MKYILTLLIFYISTTISQPLLFATTPLMQETPLHTDETGSILQRSNTVGEEDIPNATNDTSNTNSNVRTLYTHNLMTLDTTDSMSNTKDNLGFLAITPVIIEAPLDYPRAVEIIGRTKAGDKSFLIKNAIPIGSKEEDIKNILTAILLSVEEKDSSLLWAGHVFIITFRNNRKTVIKLKDLIYVLLKNKITANTENILNNIENIGHNQENIGDNQENIGQSKETPNEQFNENNEALHTDDLDIGLPNIEEQPATLQPIPY